MRIITAAFVRMGTMTCAYSVSVLAHHAAAKVTG